MKKRPHSVTVLSAVFIAAGAVGLAYHLADFKTWHPFQYDVVWVALVRLLAIVCGMFMLRGSDWARWLALIWMAYHVVLSGFHAWSELVMHVLLLAVFIFILFRPVPTDYFRGRRAEPE